MRIESGHGDTTLYLERRERHVDRVVGEKSGTSLCRDVAHETDCN